MKLFAIVALIAALGTPTAALAQLHAQLANIATDCLNTVLRDCKVLTAGFINQDQGDSDGQPMLAWQTQTGFTFEDGVMGGFVLFYYSAGEWTLVDSGFDGWRFSPPRLSESGLLHIAGYTGGTGAYNVDRLYQWEEPEQAVNHEGWRPIDMRAWQSTIAANLPKGLEIWKGVQYEFDTPWSGIIARTPLWRSDDGNCCPSGGSALIIFAIEDDGLIVSEVAYFAPGQ